MEHALLNDESEWDEVLLLTGQVPFWVEKEESCWEFCGFQYSVPRDLQLHKTGRNTGFSWIGRSEGLDR